ncbi:hypothetical protein [Prevotella aurantiaca]|jgi:hypothetical protein|uniref:Uncharacterized protein n=1 Tax=Prevotella aurantiaca TaxID=596085 RepID=A0A930HKM2_9BACT|nr:hypothetical protein [Prevotella aurantiaca]MBF1383428.1 hypothetical protein [Prevotella aurantiaca]
MFYKLGIAPSSKKWAKYENISSSLWIDNIEITSTKLFKEADLLRNGKHIEYTTLRDGKIPPINSIGADFIVFDALISDILSLNEENNMVVIESKKANNKYLLLNNDKSIDCVDWDLSEIERWPEGTKIADWQNKRGRFFIKPVLKENKIPPKTQVFRLQEWGGAFNIVISEDYKEKIMNLDFDHSFLTFECLKTI